MIESREFDFQSRDIAEGTRDFALRSRDIAKASRDFVTRTRDFAYRCRDFMIGSREFELQCRDIGAGSREFGIQCRDFTEGTRDFARASRDIAMGSREFELRCRDIAEGTRDIALRSRDFAGASRDFRTRTREFTIQCRDIVMGSRDFALQSRDFRERTPPLIRGGERLATGPSRYPCGSLRTGMPRGFALPANCAHADARSSVGEGRMSGDSMIAGMIEARRAGRNGAGGGNHRNPAQPKPALRRGAGRMRSRSLPHVPSAPPLGRKASYTVPVVGPLVITHKSILAALHPHRRGAPTSRKPHLSRSGGIAPDTLAVLLRSAPAAVAGSGSAGARERGSATQTFSAGV